MGYFKTVGIALDQLGMAVCGGDEDCTISATTGYYYKNFPDRYWKSLKWMIDTTFFPIDGEEHCQMALRMDREEKFKTGNKPVLFIFTSIFCIPLAILFWGYHIIKMAFKK